jgi:hypothetical protein
MDNLDTNSIENNTQSEYKQNKFTGNRYLLRKDKPRKKIQNEPGFYVKLYT